MKVVTVIIILAFNALTLSAQTSDGISSGSVAVQPEYGIMQEEIFWSTGELDTVFDAGHSRSWFILMPDDTVSWFMEVKYGLWNSPDVPMIFLINGDTVGNVTANQGYVSPGPEIITWHVTSNIIRGATNTIEMRSGPSDGDAVLGHIYLRTSEYLGESLTLRLSGMTPHIGQLFEARLVDPLSEDQISSLSVESIPGESFDVIFPVSEGENGYNLDFYADLSGNGDYDAPPADHAWRVAAAPFSGDTIVFFTHDTNFTDIRFPTAIEQLPFTAVPQALGLDQNYPNPFNPVTEIQFALPAPSEARLVVYNVLGRKVRTLLDLRMTAGTHTVTWLGDNDMGEAVVSGVYFYRLETRFGVRVRRMVLIR